MRLAVLAGFLSLTLFPSADSWAQRAGRARPVHLDVSSKTARPSRAPSPSDATPSTAMRAARTPRTARMKVTTFANDEVSVRLPHAVAGRDVEIRQSGRSDGPAVGLFRTFQAVEAAHMGRARSVTVKIDDPIRERFGADFVDHLLGAVNATSSERTGRPTEPTTGGERFGVPARAGRPLIWGGESHPTLLASLGRGLNTRAAMVKVSRSIDGEVALPDDPSGRKLFLVQSKRLTSPEQFHEDMVDMLKIAYQAKRAGAAEVTAVLPYLPYSRSDRMDSPGISVGAALLPKLMKHVGVDRVVFFSVHQPQEVGIFQALNMQVVHASGETIIARRMAAEVRTQGHALDDLVVVAPDAGAEKRSRVFATALAGQLGMKSIPVVTASKERNGNSITLRFNENVKGKVAIAIDDETASGGTLAELAKAADGLGARAVYAGVSHLTGNANARIEASPIKKLFVLDTLPQPPAAAGSKGTIEVVSIADAVAQIVRGLDKDRNIDAHLFLEHR